MKNRISIPIDQFKEIEEYAKEYNETPKEMVEHLLEAQLQKIRDKQVFYPGLKWGISKATFIEGAVQKRDFEKLRKWLESQDKIGIFTDGDQGKICLQNETEATKISVDNADKLKEVMLETGVD
ncbi:MAG: hypothetical protein ABSA75_03435 [Candidatus Bathyarchaeia archaeon]|jgi:hypothetical protein